MKPWVAMIVLWGFTVLAAAGFTASTAGNPAPDFTLNNLKGQPVKLSSYQSSKIVVLGLFHICDPCRKQSVELQKIYEAYKDKGVEVIGVNASGDSLKDVTEFLATVPGGVGFQYLLDPKMRIETSYNIRNTPNIVIVDKQGTIRFRAAFVPASIIEAELKKIL